MLITKIQKQIKPHKGDKMTIITIANPKGGVGKSNLACNLAVMSSNEGNRTLIVDTDPQQSAINFRNRREKDDIAAIAPSGKIKSDLKAIESNFDVAIIDCGGFSSDILIQAVGLAHLVIIPIEPGQDEYDGLQNLLNTLSPIINAKEQMGVPFKVAIMLSRVVTTAAIGKEFRESLEDFSDVATVMNSQTGAKTDFKYAHAAGLGIAEYSNSSYAAAEMRAIYKEVKSLLESL